MHSFITASLLGLLLGQATTPIPDRAMGIWRNPKDTVRIRSHRCGDRVCGTVIWASDKAKADAARGGHPQLIGLDLFQDFYRDPKGIWHGRVFVPDINKTFTGTITVLDPNTIKGTGCLLGGLVCKSQTWTRVE